MTQYENADLMRHENALYGYAMILSRDAATAADLVQETYLRAMTAKERLWENSAVKSWLLTILRNIWLNQLRKSKHETRLNEECERWDGPRREGSDARSVPAQRDDPLTQYERHTVRIKVRQAVDQLPQDFREVIVLREFEGLSYGEIASMLGSPAGTVMSRLARARTKLRSLLCEAGCAEQVRRTKSSIPPNPAAPLTDYDVNEILNGAASFCGLSR